MIVMTEPAEVPDYRAETVPVWENSALDARPYHADPIEAVDNEPEADDDPGVDDAGSTAPGPLSSPDREDPS
jgi:hypothetical protein